MAESVRIRASSVASIFDCPLRGLSIMLGLVKQCPTTAPAAIGTAVHEGTAVYDQELLNGNQIKPDDAAGVVVDYLKHPKDESVNWGKITQKEAERRALGVYLRYCTDIAPQLTYEAIELPLSALIVNVDDVEIELTGQLDRVYKSKGIGVVDLKTGVNACSQKPEKHIAQLGVYELLAEQTLGKTLDLPGLIAQLQTSAEYKVDLVPVLNAKAVLLGNGEQRGLLQHMAGMIKTGDWPGNVSSWLCSEQYCGLYKTCFFRGKL